MTLKIQNYALMTLLLLFFGGCASRTLRGPSLRTRSAGTDQKAVEHFVDGVILDLKNEFAAALLSYQEALLYDTISPAIHMAIGKDYFRLGKGESAQISFQKALELDPEELEAREFLSEIYRLQGKWDLAEKESREILARNSNSAESYLTLAHVYLQRNELEKSAAMYQRLLSILPMPDPQLLNTVGEIYLELGHLDSAAQVYEKLIELNPNTGYGYFRMGVVKEGMKDMTGAMENYSRAVQLSPEIVHARIRLGELYVEREWWDEALQLYQEAVVLDSTDLTSFQQIGNVQYEKGDTTAAMETFSQIKQRFPWDWRAYYRVGFHYLGRQEFGMAFNEFKKIIELSPEALFGWLYTGISLVHLDSLHLSQKYLLRALDLDPNNLQGNYYLGTIFTQLERPREAMPYLRTALEINPNWVVVMGSLANAYDSMEQYELSDSLYQAALQLEPNNSTILNNYAYSLSQRDIRLDDALRMASRALASEPENGAFLDTIGWIHYQREDYEEALGYIQKALSVRSESAEVVEHLGDVYEKLGRMDDARKAWESALEMDKDNPSILKKLDQ